MVEILGRARELESLRETLGASRSSLILVHGPRGTGKTLLITAALEGFPGPVIYLDSAPLEEEPLRSALEREARRTLRDFEPPDRPDLLPLPRSGREWIRLFEGALLGLGRADSPGVLVLDGADALFRARPRLAEELSDVWRRVVSRGLGSHLLIALRDPAAAGDEFAAEGALAASLRIGLEGLPVREAGWARGATDPEDAFVRWSIFGAHPEHIAGACEGEPVDRAVIRRVLAPEGDLHDAPLRRLELAFQAPGRYAGVLEAVSREDRDWGGIAAHLGAGSGNRLAPYLRRLEAEGMVTAMRPLGSRADARNRRYAPGDPFLSFWFSLVLPNRSALRREDPERVWQERILPGLRAHRDRWLPVAAREWLRRHANEALPAPAREVGALWGGDVELDVAGRLGNGQVCYGLCQRGRGTAGAELFRELSSRMATTRYGIGREARAPLVFVQGPAGEELRRRVARDPLARVVDLRGLMGACAPAS